MTAEVTTTVPVEVQSESFDGMAMRMSLVEGDGPDGPFTVMLNVNGDALYLERDGRPTYRISMESLVAAWYDAVRAAEAGS